MNPGDWMESRTNPSAILEILEIAADGNVRVRMDGKTVNTTERYLGCNYKLLGDAA